MASVAEWWKNETFIPLEPSAPTAPVPAGPGGRRWLRWVALGAVVILAASTGVLAWVAWDQHRLAQREQGLVHLQAAQLRALNSQSATTGRQLSQSNTVAGELQACIDASDRASADLFGLFTGSGHKADSICRSAEADYQALLSGG